MKKFYFLFLIVFIFILTSCSSNEFLSQYVGVYTLGSNYIEEYNYYFGKSKLISTQKMISDVESFEIKDTGEAILIYRGGNTEKGKVSTTKDTIKIKGIRYLDKYTYEYTFKDNTVTIAYRYTQTKAGLSYNYKREGLSFYRSVYKAMEKKYDFTSMSSEHNKYYIYPTYRNLIINDRDYNGLKNAILHIDYSDNSFTISKYGSLVQKGTVEINDDKYIFKTDDPKPLLPTDKEFTFKEGSDNYLYIKLKYTIQEEFEGYIQEDEYEIAFSARK